MNNKSQKAKMKDCMTHNHDEHFRCQPQAGEQDAICTIHGREGCFHKFSPPPREERVTVGDVLNWQRKHEQLTSDGAKIAHIKQLLHSQLQEVRSKVTGMKKIHENKEQHNLAAFPRGHRKGYSDGLKNVLQALDEMEEKDE
jgi:hypothetical protein